MVPGYSGGPLLDDENEVVGINTAASTNGYSGMSSGSPGQLRRAHRGRHRSGRPDRGGRRERLGDDRPTAYLGIGVADPVTARVAQVEAGGPAADAGLAAGDTITAVDDTQITSYDVLVATLATYEPGDQVTLKWTDASGASHSATVTLGESPTN